MTSKNILFILYILIFSGCKRASNDSRNDAPQAETVIQYTVLQQILPQLQSLAQASSTLEQSIDNYNNSGSQSDLLLAQQSWLSTRIIWEQYEAALYGPVTTFSIDPALDSWPINFTEIDSVLKSGKAFTFEYIDSLPETLRGFHAIEYILFGIGKSRQTAQITPRMKEFLKATGGNLKNKTHRLLNEWSPAVYNYADQFLKAGAGSNVYKSKQEALLEITGGLSEILDEVANGKIGTPFLALDSMLEESPFALNSWIDFKNNMMGVKNIYSGNGNNRALSAWVKQYNKSLDARITANLDLIIQSISAFNEPFGRSIHVNPGAITSLQLQINQLHDIFENELIPLIRLQVTT